MTEPVAREAFVHATLMCFRRVNGVPQAELIRITGAATGAVVAPASGRHR
jgi:hypothetical protein